MRAGFVREARCNLATLEVMVAEKSIVRRSSRFTACRIVSSSFSKSIESMRSASSRTRHRAFRNETPLVCWRWSTSRPGVATTTCGCFASAIACSTMSIPPTTAIACSPSPAPSPLNASTIWTASSRVGASATPYIRRGSASSRWIVGTANAPVFPDPVSASPITSRPSRAGGIASRWISVGRAHPNVTHASHTFSCTCSASHVVDDDDGSAEAGSSPPDSR
mmetsp:Transcript_9741/g.31227  ORF Transcript_9741/g.31227 Transcript_9741/m.31227 type:complete len:222 (-) Transcript_9741:99-764(-)